MDIEAENAKVSPDEFYTIEPYGRFWAVFENPEQLLWEDRFSSPAPEKRLVCVTVYKVGAEEVKKRLTGRVKVMARYPFWRQRGEDAAEFLAGAELVHERR